jgi:hypothetical protein
VKVRMDAGLPVDEEFLATLLPEHIPFKFKVLRCTHSVILKPRGNGDRYRAATMFTDCPGRITVEAVQRDDNVWVYRTKNEVPFCIVMQFGGDTNKQFRSSGTTTSAAASSMPLM